MRELAQSWPMPTHPLPIITIGAGSIVGDAHFPAYRKGGFPIAGIFDLDNARAKAVAEKFDVGTVFPTLEQALAQDNLIFDLATPPAAHAEILQICRARKLKAAVNFQLRFSPMMLAFSDALKQGLIGTLLDVEVHLAIDTPWSLFAFLNGLPRVEIAVHSIHYLDMIRSVLGNPLGVHAKTIGHPSSDMAQTRTSAILDYGKEVRCTLSINHNHNFGRKFQQADFRFDGSEGAAMVRMGLSMNYPHGERDELWLKRKGADWQQIPLNSGWFPDAFVARMANMQRFVSSEDTELVASFEDAWSTMALVEAAYLSSAAPATPLQPHP